jgi:zinc-binding alcohol dehydrogenase/oxidoreductase
MKAWILTQQNTFPSLQDTQFQTSNDLVSVELKSSALNHRDVWITKGLYPNINLPVILGSDGAGVHEGKSVLINPGIGWGKNENVQDDAFHILGMPTNGTFAEITQVPQENLFSIPDHLDFNEAAALPLAGVTAFRALITKCRPEKKSRILITGIGGGVALLSMQFALAVGCEVFVTSGSDDKLKQAMALGAAGGVNYTHEGWMKKLLSQTGGFDIIIDSAAGPHFNELLKLCRPGGIISIYGGSSGNIEKLNPQLLFWRQITITGSTMGSDQDFKFMMAFTEQHKIKPVIDSVFDFTQLDKALERMQQGKQFGKIVLKIKD